MKKQTHRPSFRAGVTKDMRWVFGSNEGKDDPLRSDKESDQEMIVVAASPSRYQ